MPTNQEAMRASVRAATGTAFFNDDDWMALFKQAGITSGTFNERQLAWINARLGTSIRNINDARRAFAINQGFVSWSAMGSFDASGTPAAPVNINAPSISGTNYYVGTPLTADPGLWSGSPAPAFTYQWKRDGVNIGSATASTYTLVLADDTKTITVAVTATNTEGNATATSAGIVAAQAPVAPAFSVGPSISGTASTGSTLTASDGTVTGNPTPSVTRQWKTNGAAISGATGTTYVVQNSDIGNTITVTVTAANTAGATSATSSATATVTAAPAAPTNTVAPVISGTAARGQTLSTTDGTWAGYPAPTYAYQWKRAGSNISGATSSSYTLVTADEGSAITVTVTATNGSGSASATSSATSAVTGSPVNTVAPSISGTPNVGSTLTAANGTWTGYPSPSYTYQWYWFDAVTPISGATSSTYVPVSGDVGHTLAVNVTATNASGAVSASSAATAAVTATAAMPSGASGIWYAQDYVSSPRKAIKNSVVGGVPSANLLPSSTDFPFVVVDDTTVTETRRAAAGPSGVGTTATRIVGSTANNYYSVGRYLTAGTYTIAADYKSNTGSNQTFDMGLYSGTRSTKTATTSYQRFSMQFTVGADGNVNNICWAVSASAFDLLIDNVQLFKGSVDLGAAANVGHMYFDKDPLAGDKTNSPSAGIVDVSSQGSALTQFGSNLNLSTFTIGAVVRRVGSGDNGYNSIFSDAVGGYSSFGAFISQGGLPTMQLNGVAIAQEPNVSGAWDQNGSGWHMMTYRYDGTNMCLFFDNQMIWFSAASLASPMSLRDFLSFAVNSIGSFTTSHQMNSMFFYPSALTNTQIKTAAYSALVAKAAENGISITPRRVIKIEGDSISAGVGGTAYHNLADGNLTTAFTKAVLAKSGNTIADAVSRAAIIGASSGSGQDILTILMGANDLQAYGGSTDTERAQNWCNAMFALTDERRAAGNRVGVCTVLPNGTSGGVNPFNSIRNIANPILRAAVGTHIDFIIDFDTDAQMGADNSYGLYPANWADTIHPSTAGQTRMEPIYRAAINALT